MSEPTWWFTGRTGGDWVAVRPTSDGLALHALDGLRVAELVLLVRWDDVLGLHLHDAPRRALLRRRGARPPRRARTRVVLSLRTGAVQLLVPGSPAGVRGAVGPYLAAEPALRRLISGVDAVARRAA